MLLLFVAYDVPRIFHFPMPWLPWPLAPDLTEEQVEPNDMVVHKAIELQSYPP